MVVKGILATNAVGTIIADLEPGDLVPHAFVDFTKLQSLSFYDDVPVTHVSMSQPFCLEIRDILVKTSEMCGKEVWNSDVIACTESLRFETPEEIVMFRRLGYDLVGMTAVPKAVLARELEMCYATACFVSNRVSGIRPRQLMVK